MADLEPGERPVVTAENASASKKHMKEAQDLLAKARSSLKSGQAANSEVIVGLKEAIEKLKRAMELDPDNLQARITLGVVYGQMGNPKEAIEVFKEAILLSPRDVSVKINLAVALGEVGDWQGAVAQYQAALGVHGWYPDCPVPSSQSAAAMAMTHRNLGLALRMLSDNDGAARHFYEAVRLQPNDPEAHCSLATFLSEQKRVYEAAKEYKEVLRLKPQHQGAKDGLRSIVAIDMDAEMTALLQQGPDLCIQFCGLGCAGGRSAC